MNNKMLEVFYYLERQLSWRVKVNYYIRTLSGFCEKTGVFSLVDVNIGKSIIGILDDTRIELEFFGPSSFIKILEVSCQEGFYIKIYETEKLNLEELNSLKSVSQYTMVLKNEILGTDFYRLYKEYLKYRNSSELKFRDLFTDTNLFSNKAKVYLFSNEPLKMMFSDKKFFLEQDLNNKKIFSITAAGDFFFNSCLLGCKNMTLVDINEYASYYFEIKKAMIKKYKYWEFISMYKDLSTIYYKFDEYSSFIREDIREEIISKFSLYRDDVLGFLKNIFWADYYEFNNIDRGIDFFRDHNLYLSSEENYNKLRSCLLNDEINLSLQVSSLFDLDFNNTSCYDYIYLSNVGDYCDDFLFYQFLINIKNKILKDTGKIILIYRTDKYRYLIDKNFCKITKYSMSYRQSSNTSMDNVILYCSFN